MSERTPLVNRTFQTLKKVTTRGLEQDFLRLLTTDVVQLYDDFTGKAIDTTIKWTTGGAGTAAAVPASGGTSGTTALVTGAVDRQGSSLYSAQLQWSGNNDCIISARIKLAAVTAVKVEVGFTDSAAAAVLAGSGSGSVNSFAATPTVQTGASDFACAIMDTAGAITSPGNWHLVGSKAGTVVVGTVVPTLAALVAPVAATYQTITVALRRVELGATDDTAAFMYVNGVLMSSITAAAITTTATLNPYIIVVSAGGVSQTMTCDWIDVRQLRDYTLG